MATEQRYDSTTQEQSTNAVIDIYWQYCQLHKFSAEEMHALRLHILFYDDLTGKLILPEVGTYRAEPTDDTCYHLGAITKPITQELSELGET